MIIINYCNPYTKFLFNPSIKNKEKENYLPFYNLFEKDNIYLYNPNFNNYFSICKDEYINLGKMTKKEIIQKKFIENIRFLTISTNIQNNNKKNNSKEKQNEKFFFEFNNVVTLSYDYLLNIDNLIENMKNISNNE